MNKTRSPEIRCWLDRVTSVARPQKAATVVRRFVAPPIVWGLVIVWCHASFGQQSPPVVDKVLYYVNSDSTKVWVWSRQQVSPYYQITIKDVENGLYQVSIQDTTAIGPDQQILLPEIPKGLHKSLAGSDFTSGTNSEIIERFFKRIRARNAPDAQIEPVQPPAINYFWHTDRVCKIWLGDFGTASYRLLREPRPRLIAAGPSGRSHQSGEELLARSLPFFMNTRERSPQDLVGELAEYLYQQRPDHEFARPVSPHAAFYFHRIKENLVQVALVSNDSASMQSVLFRRPAPTGQWSKGAVDLDLRGLDVAVNDKRPLVFDRYRDEHPGTRWTDLWHSWVAGGLSLGSPPHSMNQKDYIYRDANGERRWLWLELIEAPRFALPEMTPKPVPIVHRPEPVAKTPEQPEPGRSKFILLGFGLGCTTLLLGFMLWRYGASVFGRLKRSNSWAAALGSGNGRASTPARREAALRQDAHPRQGPLQSKPSALGPLAGDGVEPSETGVARRQSTPSEIDSAQLNHRIASLEKELQSRDKSYGHKIATLDRERQELQTQLRIRSGEITQLRAAHKQDLKRERDEIKQELAREQAQAMRALRGKISLLNKDMAAKDEAHHLLVGQMKEDLARELSDVKLQHEQTMRRIKSKHKEDIASQNADLLRIKQAHEEHVARLKEEYRDGLQQYQGLRRYVEGYQNWAEQVAALQFRLERAAINFHDREPETAGRILTMLNYSTSELLREFRPDDPDYENTRLAMITNVQILVGSVAKKHPEFHDVLRFMGKTGLLSNDRRINVVSEVPDKYADTYYHQLFKQLKGTTDRSGIHIPKMYFVFPVQENGRSQNMVLKIQSSV